MRKLLALVAGLLCLAGTSWAQSRVITGKVTNESGIPIPMVSVIVKGSSTGVTTNENGVYSIRISENAKALVFSAIDMVPVEQAIGSGSTLNIQMKRSEASMDEVIVTGYQTVRKRDVAAAIAKVSGKEFENLPNPNFVNALQGRAAGVAISAANGVPGGSSSVIIRGVGSISAGSTPLYVVDGVQMNTNTGSINTQNNPLNFINPDDIESIEVLKDAAAASIYGARAGNGVILVTTKKGKAGKTKFSVNVLRGESSAIRMFNVLNTQEWYNVRYEALANANPAASASAIRATVLSNLGLNSSVTDGFKDSLPTYDWQDETFGKGSISTIEASMSGGSQQLSYYISASHSKQEAFIAPTNFNRSALLSKVSYKINNKFTFENSLSLSTTGQNAPYSLGNTGFGNPAYAASMILPVNPFYNPDGSYYGLPGTGINMVGTFNHNILAVGDYVKYFTRTNQLVGSASLTYKILPSLSVRTLVGMDYRLTKDNRYQDPRVNDGFAVQGRLSNQADFNTNFITTTTVNFNKEFKEVHSVNAFAGVEYRNDQFEWFQADGQGFPSYLLQYLSSASTPTSVSGNWQASATFSQFGKVGYTYDGKYVFNYSVRRDGSSRFGANSLYGTFHSAQVAWNMKNESFLRNVKFVTDLKLRYAYGEAGNDQFGNFQWRQLYGAARIYGGNSAINPSQLGNPDLTWETRTEHNVGLDAYLFNNRLNITVDAYRRLNKDLLLNRPLYITTGFSTIAQNLGAMENKGLEIFVEGKIFDGQFKWTSAFNIAFQKNQVTRLYDGLTALPSNQSIQVGQPLGAQFTQRWAGVNPATGRGMWYDINGNITYNPTAADRVFVGNIYPTHFGGWNNNFSYKGFSLIAFFQYDFGRSRADGQLTQFMRMGGTTVNAWKDGYDQRWQQPGDITWVPRPFNGMADFNSVGWASGSRYIYKTDYIRLKQLTIAYDLPSSTLKKANLEGVRFYVQGVNLWTSTEWLGYDPEFTGDNFGIIPPSKNITVGLQFRF